MEGKILYNNKVLKERRRDLRNSQTDEEKILWLKLKNRKLSGFRFVRQYSVGPYILDFYCPKLRLAVEVDGDSHRVKETIEYDQERDSYLRALDIFTLRFWNSEIRKDVNEVIKRIKNQITPS